LKLRAHAVNIAAKLGLVETSMRKLLILAAAAAALMTSACNTVEGMGRDLQAAGSAVTGSAESAKR